MDAGTGALLCTKARAAVARCAARPPFPLPSPRSNWRRGQCGGYSVSVLLKELDRRGLVMAREEMSSGKRICIFRNLAC